jgi:hypothetical protein
MTSNKEYAKELNTTSRQVSKSRKKGFIIQEDGIKKQFTAPKIRSNISNSWKIISRRKNK